MTDLKERYCEEYLIDLSIVNAAKRAGVQGDNPNIVGWQFMQDPEVQDRIEELKRIRSERTGITADKVLREVARISFSDIREYYNEDGTLKNITDLSDDAAAALSAIKTEELFEMDGRKKVFTGYSKEIKTYDKPASLEKLMKHLGLYNKDNEQSRPVLPKTMAVTIVPPTPEDE